MKTTGSEKAHESSHVPPTHRASDTWTDLEQPFLHRLGVPVPPDQRVAVVLSPVALGRGQSDVDGRAPNSHAMYIRIRTYLGLLDDGPVGVARPAGLPVDELAVVCGVRNHRDTRV